MEREGLIKRRTVIRAAFTRFFKQLDELLSTVDKDLADVRACWDMLVEKADQLKLINEGILDSMIKSGATEDELTAEVYACDEYNSKFAKIKVRYNDMLEIEGSTISSQTRSQAENSGVAINTSTSRKFNLPQLELKKFGGDVRDWLPFWSQFKKIDADNDIAAEDKFQYLLLAITPNTRARDLVESFPPTAENYKEAMESLRSRFGREDLLVEVYVRELLKLILKNNGSGAKRGEIHTLYDKVETQLRALETLGVTTDTCAAMLYPLVESCLPEDLLRAWQRSSQKLDVSLKNRLKQLMSFLRAEVEGEQRISLAIEGFDLNAQDKSKKSKAKSAEPTTYTATGLVNQVAEKCYFCEGNHTVEKCFKTKKMSLEEKRQILIKNKACFRCARIGHRTNRCRSRVKCLLCDGAHIVVLCPNLDNKSVEKTQSDNLKDVVVKEQSLANHTDTRVFLQTLVVKLYSECGEEEVRALIDTGSQKSYILQTVAQRLKYVPKRSEKVVHALFGGVHSSEQNHSCYDVRVKNIDGSFACKFEVLDQPVICSDISPVPVGVWTKELNERGIKLTDTKGCEPISLLIGADVAGKLFTGRKTILPCKLVAMETSLSWILMGKISSDEKHVSSMLVTSLLSNTSVEALWRLDVLGISDPGERKTKEEEEMALMEFFQQTVTVDVDGRYETKLPWKEGHPPVPSNYSLAKNRLETTKRKLISSNSFKMYGDIFQKWESERIIEEVPKEEVSRKAHYLPHRPVFKESSNTTKIRPVFDASAKEKGKPSLNDCLEKGVNLIERIPKLLLKFRQFKFGLTSDIEKAFLQIGVSKSDRDFLRFLWVNENGSEKIFRHRRVVFGVNSSPFLLGSTVDYHLKNCREKCESEGDSYTLSTVVKLQSSFYVDNCVCSVSDHREIQKFIREATNCMLEGKFVLRGWEFTGKTCDPNESVPILGLAWNTQSDMLFLNSLPTSNEGVVTKRVILSVAQQIYDPIGFTCPTTLIPKLLIQKMWKEKIGWDTEVDEETVKVFRRWREEVAVVGKIEIPRWIFGELEDDKASLHIFCDASQSACAAVVYLRIIEGDKVHVSLLQAKSRVTPLKKLSIPRLELLAATFGARLFAQVKEVLTENLRCYFWSDSTTVLSWITRSEDWATFVWNRVREIRNLTPVECWRHVPGGLNPADMPSRGCFPRQLIESRWWEGPSWLYESPENWPKTDMICDEAEINSERKGKVVASTLSVASDDRFYRYFSKYNQLVRLIGWIFRFVNKAKKRNNREFGDLSNDELEKGEAKLLWLVQKTLSEKDEILRDAKKDENGLWRLTTRISNRNDIYTFLYPVVLPGCHPVVKRLIFDTHVKYCHVGVQGLISILREKYWILGGRRSVRSVIARCAVCKRYSMKRLEVDTPPLPLNRVKDASCFEVVGVDFAGPVHLRNGEKIWISIFTCAVYRAVHFDLVSSISTESFINVLRRFIARRGRPQTIYSDNGTNFHGTENIFNQLDWEKVNEYSTVQRINWYFSPPSAPWWGGWWERLIGLLKQLLRKVLGRACLRREELYTILCDCESTINSRPLTYISDDPKELVALTPAMFLRDLPESGVPDCDVSATNLSKRYQYLQKMRESLRARFRVEYLGQLQQCKRPRKTGEIVVGDVVLVGSDNNKRTEWPLAKVVETFPGKDGKVRLVRVQTAYGLLLRPIQRLYPLECAAIPGLEVRDKVHPAIRALVDDENDPFLENLEVTQESD